MGLVIDTHQPEELPLSEEEITGRKNLIMTILEGTSLIDEFIPTETNVTLSSEIGFTKSENMKNFINTALRKLNKRDKFSSVIFVTEDSDHITKAKTFNLNTIHFTNKPDNELRNDEINSLFRLPSKIIDLIS